MLSRYIWDGIFQMQTIQNKSLWTPDHPTYMHFLDIQFQI